MYFEAECSPCHLQYSIWQSTLQDSHIVELEITTPPAHLSSFLSPVGIPLLCRINVATYPLSHFLGSCCPWTRDVLSPNPTQMLWEAWYSDLGWADPATPSAHRNRTSFVPLFGFLFFGGFFFFFNFSFPPVSNPVPQGFS